MKRLELITMSHDQHDAKPTRDDVIALLSEAMDRPLSDDENAVVEEAIRADPSLLALREGFARGRALLKSAPRLEAPPDLLPRVHRALAAERRAPVVERADAPPTSWRWPSLGLVAALAVGVAVVVVVAPNDGDLRGAAGVGAAGVGAADVVERSKAMLALRGVDAEAVREMARDEGLSVAERDGALVVSGEARFAQRFVARAKAAALDAGGEASGFAPDEGTVELVVTFAP